MATLIGKKVGKVSAKVVDFQGKHSNLTQGPINKIWRTMVVTNRIVSPMPKAGAQKISGAVNDIKNLHFAKEKSLSLAQKKDQWTSRKRQVLSNGGEDLSEFKKDFSKPTWWDKPEKLEKKYDIREETKKEIHNDIIIVNRNVSPPVCLVLQNRPTELNVDPQSHWARVKSMGRNNPFMMYTGGEDTITIPISWFANDPEYRDDVINKCRLLESWSRANGYNASPPTLEIIWGSSGIFDNDKFILESAPYTLSNFQDSTRVHQVKGNNGSMDRGREQVDLGLFPNTATQNLVFCRVTRNNRTHEEIVSSSDINRTSGIIIG